MADITDSTEDIQGLLSRPRRIAMVGASDKPNRESNGVFKVLVDAGHDVLPVNPTVDEVHGVAAVPDLDAAADHWDAPIEVVDVFRAPEHVPAVVDEAIDAGAEAIWFQLGVIHEEGIQKALDAGMDVVVDRCMKVEQGKVGPPQATQ